MSLGDESKFEEKVRKELKVYKRRYYLNKALKGGLLLLSSILSAFLVWNVLEFSFEFGTQLRTFLFFSFLILTAFSIAFFLFDPLMVFLKLRVPISDEYAAKAISRSDKSISDRLLNYLQLSGNQNNPLARAGAVQKSKIIANHTFANLISFSTNKKYIKYLVSPATVILILLFARPEIFTESTARIINYDEEYVPKAPFEFNFVSEKLAFRNEDYTFKLELRGNSIPEEAYLTVNDRKIKLFRNDEGLYVYTFSKIQYNKSLYVEAAGFISPKIDINVVDRPNLESFNVFLDYPEYTGRPDQRVSNKGNLNIPQGTTLTWEFATNLSSGLNLKFENTDTIIQAKKERENTFKYKKQFYESSNYEVILKNNYSDNKSKILYRVDVLRDRYPEINVNVYEDTLLYNMIVLGGNISDDYGLRRLNLHYEIRDKNRNIALQNSVPISINQNQISQGYYEKWNIDSLEIKPGSTLNYYLSVWDNDQINGSKSTKTRTFSFKLPTRNEIKDELDKSNETTQSKIDNALKNAEELKKKLEKAERDIKGKKNLTWEEEKNLRELLKKREEINKAIQEMQEMNRQNNQKRERFTPQSESLKEKSEQLQQLMDDLMDEETRELYEALKKMLEDKVGVEKMQQMVEQINQRQRNLDNELERTLELFKKLKLENEVENLANELKNLADEQNDLSEKTDNEDVSAEELNERQKEINDSFDETEKSLEKISEMNQELKNPEMLPDNSQIEQNIDKQLKDIQEKLEELKNSEELNKDNQSSEQNTKSKDETGDEPSNENKNSSEKTEESQESTTKTQEDQNIESTGEEKSNEQQEESDSGETDSQETQDGEKQQGAGGEMPEPDDSRKRIQKKQKKAAEEMKKMSAMMQNMKNGMEMEMMTENINDLRNILYNLLQLSFNQEKLMNEFKDVNEVDPKYVNLSQQQLKLRDDSRVIEDSLLSLAERVFQIKSFVTREVTDMNSYMESAMDALKERRKYVAVGDQQFAMTSMNNLALLLDDVLDQLLENMAGMMGSGQQKQQQQQQESMGEMQRQLNQKIQELKDSGKSGRELSEELAKLAAEQARIRKMLQEEMEKYENGGQNPGGNIPAQMERSELDLVKKKLTQQLIRRQESILTRLLESEKAMREKELDEERKGETANDYEKVIPDSFEEYLKQKEKEVEMLKTLPPKLYPYYKKEVSEYFKRIGEGTN